MEKYQITGTQVSFRVNNEERAQLNELAIDLQAENKVQFNNSKDLVFAIVEKSNNSAANVVEVEKEVIKEVEVIPTDLSAKFAEIKASVFDDEELTELEMLDTLIQIITTPTPAVEIEKEVMKEVERPISENEVLVPLLPNQKEILKRIADHQFKRFPKNGQLTEGEVMRKMCFNMATLTDYGEMFETGISEREFKQKMRKPQNH